MTIEPSSPDRFSAGNPPDAARIRDLLRRVIDPELGKDIVALGLVYRIDSTADCLFIEMTMTSPACPMGEMILDDVRAVLAAALPESSRPEVRIRLVWEPPWTPSMMDAATREQFGWAPDH